MNDTEWLWLSEPDSQDYDRPCRYGNCVDTYGADGRIWGGFGPVDCPHETRGGLREHGTWAEQYAPRPARNPRRRRPGWRRP